MTDAAFPVEVYQGLVSRGIPAPAAIGAAVGVAAEGGSPTAVNPKSGAFGYGQWLGPRKDALFSAYGGQAPTPDQQIDYLAWEMKGGDKGMSTVLNAPDPHTAAQLYLQNGMRPGAGLPGDIKRARAILANAPTDATVIPGAPQNTPDPFDPAGPASFAHGPTSAKPDPNDPFDPYVSAPASGGSPDHQGGNRGNGLPADASGRVVSGDTQGVQGGPPGGQNAGLQPHQVGVPDGIVDVFGSGLTAGLIHPVTAAINTVLPLDKLTNSNVKSVWDGTSLGDAFDNNLAIERGNYTNFQNTHPVTALVGDIAGAAASPFNKLFAPAEGAGFLRSIPNFMAQGAVYGGVRGAADTGDPATAATDAGIGAVLGPASAAVGHTVGKVAGGVSQLPQIVKAMLSASVKHRVSSMIDNGASVDQILAAIPEAKSIANIPSWVQYRAKGGKAPVAFAVEAPAEIGANDVTPAASQRPAAAAAAANDTSTPDQQRIVITAKKLGAALGTQANRRGIEAVTDMPPQVVNDVQRLTTAGVSPQEAQAEADINYVGGQPTVAAVTRNPAEQRAMFEGAKLDTPEGAQLAQTIANNNQAVHDAINQTVDGLGGVPAQGEAAETAAQSLAQASDAARANVTAKYNAARATDGDVKINTDELRELLQSPEMVTPTNPQVKQLAQGVLSHLQAGDSQAGTTLRTPEQIEQIRQLANSAYDPMGGPVNSAVGKIGSALNDSLDQLDTASAAWKAARGAHRNWASQYSDPAGVAKLIARDAQGNFLNADQWRLSENGLIDRLNDQPFAQVVTQLKNIEATDALNKLKAGIVQRAYERSTNSARDQLGNPIVNGKLFQNELNKIGMPKLQTLFSPQELAHLATIGRAARAMNEAVPGTVNTSGTSSSLINALKAKPGSHPVLLGTKVILGAGGHLPLAVGIHGAEALSKGAAKGAINQGIREQMNTGLARAMAKQSQRKIANAQTRQMYARALRTRSAVTAQDNDRARAIGRRLSSGF